LILPAIERSNFIGLLRKEQSFSGAHKVATKYNFLLFGS
jgi:hypothetical protein